MTDVLASWNEGRAKNAGDDFVASATQPGPGFVEEADRIATFDNDGTLWVEQPLPPQFDFGTCPRDPLGDRQVRYCQAVPWRW